MHLVYMTMHLTDKNILATTQVLIKIVESTLADNLISHEAKSTCTNAPSRTSNI